MQQQEHEKAFEKSLNYLAQRHGIRQVFEAVIDLTLFNLILTEYNKATWEAKNLEIENRIKTITEGITGANLTEAEADAQKAVAEKVFDLGVLTFVHRKFWFEAL